MHIVFYFYKNKHGKNKPENNKAGYLQGMLEGNEVERVWKGVAYKLFLENKNTFLFIFAFWKHVYVLHI